MKGTKQKLISAALTLCMVFNLSAQALAGTIKGGSLNQGKGKYYGKDLKQKDKINTINSEASKTSKTPRKPIVKDSKPAFEFSLNSSQEVKEKRTSNSKTFKEGNGKLKTYVYLDKIHFKDASGKFQDIDNTLAQQGKGDNAAYENKANDFKVNFPAKITKDKGVNLVKDDSSIQIIPMDGDFSKSSIAENSILY